MSAARLHCRRHPRRCPYAGIAPIVSSFLLLYLLLP